MEIEATVLRKLRFRIVYFVFVLYMLFALHWERKGAPALRIRRQGEPRDHGKTRVDRRCPGIPR